MSCTPVHVAVAEYKWPLFFSCEVLYDGLHTSTPRHVAWVWSTCWMFTGSWRQSPNWKISWTVLYAICSMSLKNIPEKQILNSWQTAWAMQCLYRPLHSLVWYLWVHVLRSMWMPTLYSSLILSFCHLALSPGQGSWPQAQARDAEAVFITTWWEG